MSQFADDTPHIVVLPIAGPDGVFLVRRMFRIGYNGAPAGLDQLVVNGV